VLSDAVTNLEGYRLDGEWVNPASVSTTNALVSEFPSGDGHAGGNFKFAFTLLAGDPNRDTIIDIADVTILWTNYYYFLSGSTFTDGDADGDGAVLDSDIDAFGVYVDLHQIWTLGDLNGDYIVNDADLNVLIANYGLSNRTHAQGDLNGDGQGTMADFDLALAQYGLELSTVS
jgi:hypothetical protein